MGKLPNARAFYALLLSLPLFLTVVAHAQNVGINTATPNYTVDVRGKNVDDGALLQLANEDQSHKILFFSGRQNDPNPFMQWKAGSPMRFVTDEGGFKELMRISSNGNVGVGTSMPEVLMHLRGNMATIRIESVDNSDPELSLASPSGGTAYIHKFNTGRFLIGSGGDYNMAFLNSVGGSFDFQEGASTRLRISPGGNVGIGTSSPFSTLHLAVPSVPRFQMTSQSTGHTQEDGLLMIIPAGTSDALLLNRENARLEFGTNNLSRVAILGNGNVGIGISNPDVRLGVANTFRVTGTTGSITFHPIYAPALSTVLIGDFQSLDENGPQFRFSRSVPGFMDMGMNGQGDFVLEGNDIPLLTISNAGRVGILRAPFPNATFTMRSKADDLFLMYLEDNNQNLRFGVGREGAAGFNTAYAEMTLTVRGIAGHNEYFRVESPASAPLFRVLNNGNVAVSNTLSKGGGSFKIDHPLDPENKYLYHSFVESPDMMNVYNGNITTGANGEAVVTMPEWFEALNKDFRYQLTIIGQPAQAWIESELKGNQFTLKTDKPSVKVSWQITGIRKDAWANKNRIPVEEDKPANERGRYQHPESFGKPVQRGVGYQEKDNGTGNMNTSFQKPK